MSLIYLFSDWYGLSAVVLNTIHAATVVNALYDLNDVQFDLTPTGYDLDTAWPTFARKTLGAPSPYLWKPPSRTTSTSSINSQVLNLKNKLSNLQTILYYIDHFRFQDSLIKSSLYGKQLLPNGGICHSKGQSLILLFSFAAQNDTISSCFCEFNLDIALNCMLQIMLYLASRLYVV